MPSLIRRTQSILFSIETRVQYKVVELGRSLSEAFIFKGLQNGMTGI